MLAPLFADVIHFSGAHKHTPHAPMRRQPRANARGPGLDLLPYQGATAAALTPRAQARGTHDAGGPDLPARRAAPPPCRVGAALLRVAVHRPLRKHRARALP